ncbi:sulfatase [Marinoscillum sp. MHG1-6]|uniref:sulfatase family protein n=1 Tax=Marinoscillum sp. MHG1-6 TaxID=2959627 RepID=UPI0021585F44|nr:sulfatase [Marinoscillum sp. MHG1-6]
MMKRLLPNMRNCTFILVLCSSLSLVAQNNEDNLQDRPNVLWLVIEDTSPYQFSCYGNRDIATPEIDELAKKGILYTNASANAPHCSPARSTLITGSYATTYGMDIHRQTYDTPEGIFYPEYLRKTGYFCTNNAKTDYNTTINNDQLWDESGLGATYNSPSRKEGQPFFAIFNTEATHMGLVRTITAKDRPDFKQYGIDEENIFLPAHVPDLPEVRSDEAYMLKASQESSKWAQSYMDDLKEKGLDDNTIVFFFSDHGGCLPRGKGFPFESGLKVPLVIYVPPAWQEKLGVKPGTVDSRLVGFVDFAPTLLSLAGVKPPEFMQGDPFMGKFETKPAKFQYGFRSNQENYHYDPCRTVSDGNFKYIKNYVPHKPFCLRNLYQWGMPANQAWDQYVMSGECTRETWLQPFRPKGVEMLFELKNDPWELNNLANDPQYQKILKGLRKEEQKELRRTQDLGLFVRGIREVEGGLYNWVRAQDFVLKRLYEAADLASRAKSKDIGKLNELLQSPYAAIRYWGAIGYCTLGSQRKLEGATEELKNSLNDESKEVACAAAEALCYLGEFDLGIQKLIDLYKSNFNLAYSSIETLTWYPEEKKKLQVYLPVFLKIAEEQAKITQEREGLAIKNRSILVNLGVLPLDKLYSEEERKKGEKANASGRKFRYAK